MAECIQLLRLAQPLAMTSYYWNYRRWRTKLPRMRTSTMSAWLFHFIFDPTINSVVELIGENCFTNRSFARMFGPLYIGCHIHKINFAVNDILNEHEDVNLKVKVLMKKMCFNIPAALLRRYTHLRVKKAIYRRWSMTFEMICRYRLWRKCVTKVDHADVGQLFMDADEDSERDALKKGPFYLDSVKKGLQSDSVTLAYDRIF